MKGATMSNIIQSDDWVHDPTFGRWRRVARADESTVHMVDGGCMRLDECVVVALPSEDLHDRHYDRTFKSHRDALYSAWAGDVVRKDADGLFGFIPPAEDRRSLDGDVMVT